MKIQNAKLLFVVLFLFSSLCLCKERILLVNSSNNFSIYAPIIKQEGLISAKEVVSCLKGVFEWNPVLSEALLKKDNVKCFVWIGKNRAILDKKEITLSVSPKLIEGHVFVPLELVKAFSERLNIALDVSEGKIVFGKNAYNNTKDGFWHILKEGETLYRISKNYGVDLSSILSLNKIIDPRFIIPGTVLYIPSSVSKEKEEEIPISPILEKSPKGKISRLRNYGIKRIVIDPGHGGKDPGAIGKTGLKEKDVVLEIALSLCRELKKRLPNVEIILTRDADFYIPLSERTALANFKKADLFVSLHANAAFSGEASGFEVYHLSAVASDKYSKELADAENIVTKRFKEKESLTDIILKDIAQSEFINESIDLCLEIQNKVCEELSMKNRGVKSAFFYVLRDAKMPAVLIETGFLSNQEEEARMKQDLFKKTLISAIASAIVSYKEKYENKLVEK